jgi:DNA-binding beta-propeller fold protein YncE
MWVANYNDDTVSVVRASDGTLVTTIVSPTVGPDPIALAFDGANMWVVNENAYGDRGSVSIIRVVDHTLVATVPVGKEPEAIAFDGANMWIANFYDDTVSKR